jgi:hypothetical protein
LAGCSAPPVSAEPTLARVSAENTAAYDRLWDSVGDTLRNQYFDLDRQDRLEGVITTLPVTSSQFFELWRPQPETLGSWGESNLQTIQRMAMITIKPASEGGAYDLGVQVDESRYSLPERQIDNSAGALRLYSSDAPTETGDMERVARTAQMIPLGRNKPAEERLLKLILDRYAKTPATQPAAARPDERQRFLRAMFYFLQPPTT